MRIHALIIGLALGLCLLWSCAALNSSNVEQGITTGIDFAVFQTEQSLETAKATRAAAPADALGLEELDEQIRELEELLFYLQKASELSKPLAELFFKVTEPENRSTEPRA